MTTPPAALRRIASPRALLGVAVAAWIAASTAGAAALARHAGTPGPAAAPAVTWHAAWPESAAAPTAAGRPRLVVVAHPHCPCTRTTLSELKALVPTLAQDPQVLVLFERPEGLEPGWERGRGWDAALEIPGALVLADEGGRAASRFGARTSGTVLLYDARGRLLFDGGVTTARGHAGESDGARAIRAILAGREGARTAPVFGCGLESARETPP